MDDEVSVPTWGPTRCCELWNWPRDTEWGKWDKWSDPASTRLCPFLQHRAESGGGPRSQSMGRGGWLQPQEGSQFVGIPALGLGPGPSHHSLSQETIIIKCPGRFPGPGGPVSSEAPEESLFQGKMCSGPSLASVPTYNAI